MVELYCEAPIEYNPNDRPALGVVLATELYDHRVDLGIGPAVFDEFENVNLAADPAFASAVTELRQLLHTQFQSWPARPGPGPDRLHMADPA